MAEATKIQYVVLYPAISTHIERREVAASYNPPYHATEFRSENWDQAHAYLCMKAEQRVGKAREELAASKVSRASRNRVSTSWTASKFLAMHN